MGSIRLRTIYTWLFILGLFFIPFNSFKGISFLGEYQKESAALFFIVGCAVLGVEILIKKSFTFPAKNAVFLAVLLFLVWCIIATLLNLGTVMNNELKTISGLERFVRQYIALLLMCFFFLVFFINTLKSLKSAGILKLIRRIFLASLVVVAVYGILETLIIVYGQSRLIPMLRLFNYFPFVEVSLVGDRISSVSYEVPSLAIYLITICGWMLSYIVTSKRIWRFVPALVILVLTFYSGSRTGLVVIAVQYLLFFGVLLFWKEHRKNVLYLFFAVAVVAVVAVLFSGGGILKKVNQKLESLDFEKNLRTSVSNQTRFGMQYASYRVFEDNPVSGAGFGQLAFEAYPYYPAWAVTRNYEYRLNYKNQRRDSFPPSYNIYLRIMAESGLIGGILFLSIIVLAIYKSLKMFRSAATLAKVLGLVLLVSVVGLSLNWLQIDTYRIFGFWLCIAILALPFDTEDKEQLNTIRPERFE